MSKTTNTFSTQVRERAAQLVLDRQCPHGWCRRINNRRLLEAIGYIPPAATEATYSAAPEIEDLAAQLFSVSLRQTQRGSTCQTVTIQRGQKPAK